MKISLSSFGFISATVTSASFLPYALVLLGMIFFHQGLLGSLTPILLFFTITARVAGDWIFWVKCFPREMDKGSNPNWRSSIKEILSTQPPAIKSINDMLIDSIVDGALLYLAFKASASPLWILFVYSCCQTVGAPLQVAILRIFDRKYVRKFSMIITALATFMALEVNGIISVGYASMLGLSRFSPTNLILCILGTKCLLASTALIAKATIAETLKLKTMKELST